jgi:hypothetical protein
MRRLRFRLPLLAALLLAGQTAALAVAPVSLAIGGQTKAAECECPGGMAGQACPMHRSPNREAGPENRCALSSTCAPDDAALMSLGMGLGVLPEPVDGIAVLARDEGHALQSRLSGRAVPPDPFPPRA